MVSITRFAINNCAGWMQIGSPIGCACFRSSNHWRQSLAYAAIAFMPVGGGRFGYGVTDEDGQFRIGTFTDSDGAIVGEHRISISLQDIISPAAKGRTPEEEQEMDRRGESLWVFKSRIPEKYASPETSGISVKVEKGMPPLTIQLSN